LLASKNGFGYLTGMGFFRRQLKNWQKTERATTSVCIEYEITVARRPPAGA
jgi:hypothetical protein